MPSAARESLLDLLAAAELWNAAALNTPVAAVKATPEGIDAMVQGYVDDLTRDFLDVLDGSRSIPKSENGHRGYVQALAEPAYDAGMTEGGADPADKDDIDEAAINDWVSTQEQAIGGLWDDIKQLRSDKKDLSKDEFAARQLTINNQLELWGKSLRNLYSLAKANAQRKVMVTWKFGDTDHCPKCQWLNGQRHKLGWFLDNGYIPQENGSETLDCHGFHCQCELRDDKDNVVMP